MAGSNVIREFFGSLGLEVDEGSFKKGEEAFGRIRSALETGAIAFAGFSAAVGFATHQFVQQSDKLDDWRALTGASVETLGALQIAAKGVGSDVQTLIFGMTRLSTQFEAISQGKGKGAAKALKELGLSAKELQKVPVDQAMEKIQLALAGVGDASKRTALSSDIFGARFARTLNTIDPKQLKAIKDEALELGIVMSGEDVEAGNALNAQLSIMGGIFQALSFDVVRGLLPAFQEMIGALKEWYRANQATLRLKIKEYFTAIGDAMVYGLKHVKLYLETFLKLVGGLDGLVTILKVVGALIGGYLVLQLGIAITAFGAFVASIEAANLWLLATNALLLITPALVGILAVALFLIFDELTTRLKGGRGLIDDFLNPKGISPSDNILVKALREIVLVTSLATRTLSDFWSVLTGGSAIRNAALSDLKNVVHLQSGGLLGQVSQEERARFLAGLPFQQPTDVQSLAVEGPGLLSVPGSSPSIPIRGDLDRTPNDTRPVSIVAPITITGVSDPQAAAAAAKQHLDTSISQAAERLAGGG